MNLPEYIGLAEVLKEKISGDVSILDNDREKVSRDTSLFYIKPEIVVYPKNKEDIKSVISIISNKKNEIKGLSVAFRAAGTCMTGGPLSKSVVVDTTKYMNNIFEVTEDYAITEPGVFYRDFEKETLKKGWIMPSYPASRELAAIGGIISNNSGGEKTLTYGKTEKYVKSLEVVYANGEEGILKPLSKSELDNICNLDTENARIHREMYKLIEENYKTIMKAKPTVSKNSSGYYLWNVYDKEKGIFDLSKLVVGSQGTLAAVSSATINGVKPKNHSRMLIMFVPSTTHLGEIIPRILSHKPETLESYDDHTFKIALRFFKDIAIRMGGNMFTLGIQFIPEFWMALTGGVPKIILMAEFTGDTELDVERQINNAYKDMKSFNLPIKMTHSARESKKYWTFRRESFNLLRSKLHGYRTAPTIDDIVVHPKDLPEFLPKLEDIFKKYPELIYTVAGHMGDANFHIIPLVNIHDKEIPDILKSLMNEVYELVFKYNGSMSAEHNDGLLRTPYINKMFTNEIVQLFEQTKNIFDQKNILNPGKKVFGDFNYSWDHLDIN